MSSATQQHSRKHANRAWRQKVRARDNRRFAWMRPIRRLQLAIERSLRLIESTRQVVEASETLGAVRPIRTSRKLARASGWLVAASAQLSIAARGFDETADQAVAAPQFASFVPDLLASATVAWLATTARLAEVSSELYGVHCELVDDLKSGRVLPERVETAADRRPRIIVRIPHLIIAARAFLLQRRSSVRDRIASVPVRRRRQALVVVTDAPRRISRGRAPPSSDCRF
jgi:hypothetical protein